MSPKSLALITLACCVASAQAAPHKNHPPKQLSLEDRFPALACSLVVIQTGNRLGTGFYINADGDLVTALHVLGDKIFEPQNTGGIKISLVHVPTATIKNHKEEFSVKLDGNLQTDGDTWGTDITVLKTGRPTDCWLKIGDDKLTKVGQHVIAMGFPGLAFGSLSLYSGIVSGKLKSSLITGKTLTGQPLLQTNDFIRIQMPISPGISGAPVINDMDEAIAVVTQAGAWSDDLDALTKLQQVRDSSGTPPDTQIDALSAVAHLAEIVHNFASPGYGDSVPLSYLPPKTLQGIRKPSSSSQQRR